MAPTSSRTGAPARARGLLRALRAVVVIGVVAWAGEGRADTWANGAVLSVDGPYTGPSGMNFIREEFSDASPDETSEGSVAVTSPSGFGPLADAAAEAAHGLIRARAYTTHSGAGVYQGGVDVSAGFSDALTFTAPGRAGLQGTVTLGMRVDGTMSSSSTQPAPQLTANSDASIELRAESSVDEQSIDRYPYSSSEDGWSEHLEAEELTLTVGFVFGDPLYVDFSLDLVSNLWVDSSAAAPGLWVATGIADFQNTATWAGILDLRDAEGDPVEEFEVTSASGTDYRGPIAAPEPAAALRLGAGVAALLVARSVRRGGGCA